MKTGQIFAAGLDVMTPEPLPATDPLLQLPNCGKSNENVVRRVIYFIFLEFLAVIIPHLATQTIKPTTEMGMRAANNILNALEGKPMLSPAY